MAGENLGGQGTLRRSPAGSSARAAAISLISSKRLAAAAVASLVVLACTGLAAAQENATSNSGEPLSSVLKTLNLKANTGSMPNFVVKSRPPADTLHYIPVGAPRPEPTTPVLTVEQIKAEESALDALRTRDERIAGRGAIPAPPGSVADGRKPPRRKPPPPKCILTCDILHIPKPGSQ